MLDKIKREIDKHKIISFDIFDTLLVRPYVKPTDLFKHIEFLTKNNDFCEKRINAERMARECNYFKEEIILEDIYEQLFDPYKKLLDIELKLEEQLLYPNLEIKEAYNYAQSRKKKIIIVSDMYLKRSFLERVLKKNGYENYHQLFVSSEIGKTKSSGSLYHYINTELKLSKGEIFHIGDNKDSDFIKAKENGWDAFLYPKIIDQLFSENKRALEFYNYENGWLGSSILLGTIAMSKFFTKKNYWKSFGFTYAGPIIYAYMKWLDNKLQSDKIKEILFVARDGYTLQKVFDLIQSNNIRTHYFYAPRIINLVCNLNYEKYAKINEIEGMDALRSILSFFKMKNDYLKNNTPEITNVKEGDKFIRKNKNLFIKLSEKEKLNYQNYFNSLKIQNKNIGVIDTCSSKLSAQKAVMIGLPNHNIRGYYWSTWEGTQDEIQKYQTSTFQISHKQEFLDWNMMEWYMTAPTPPVEYIDDNKVIFKPLVAEERKRIEIYPDLSSGIIEYAKLMHKIFGNLEVFITDTDCINWTNILCLIPTQSDKNHFKKIKHAWDVNHTKYIPFPANWFNDNIPNGESLKGKNFYFFNKLLLIKRIARRNAYKYLLFSYIPLLKIKFKNKKSHFKLFSFIPILKKKIKTSYSGNFTERYFLFNLIPFVKLKHKFIGDKKTSTFYLFGLLIFKSTRKDV